MARIFHEYLPQATTPAEKMAIKYLDEGVIQNYAALLQAGKSNLCLMSSSMHRGQYR